MNEVYLSKRYLVVGLGTSGRAACRYLLARGAQVIAVDGKQTPALEALRDELQAQGAQVTLGTNRLPIEVDRVVLSPGVPPKLVEEHRRLGVEVLSEIDLALETADTPVVAVTGTNGKSTVVTNLARRLQQTGHPSRALGNLGEPLTEWASNPGDLDFLVLEVSSYQLETTNFLRPQVAIILNVAPDHLTRHPEMTDYVEAKSRITNQQTIEDALVLHQDLQVWPELQRTRARLYWYGCRFTPNHEGLFLDGSDLVWQAGDQRERRSVDVLGCLPHEIDNQLAVAIGLLLVGVSFETVCAGFSDLEHLPHRLEEVGTAKGVRYINDSKATNAHAAIAALKAFDCPLVWLVGGQSKGEDLSELMKCAGGCFLRAVICFGQDGHAFAATLPEHVVSETHPSLSSGLEAAARLARSGDVVLLSPAGASFDEFGSFEERGDMFRNWVKHHMEVMS